MSLYIRFIYVPILTNHWFYRQVRGDRIHIQAAVFKDRIKHQNSAVLTYSSTDCVQQHEERTHCIVFILKGILA